jgi:hypothetical protein
MTDPQQTISIADGEVLHLTQPGQRSTAIHELVGRVLPRINGEVVWADAADHAVPAALAEHADHPRRLDRIQIARGFTAYQHHEIIRELPRIVDSSTGLIVVPAVACLYRDDDVPGYDAERYLVATVRILEAVAETFDVPVLVSTATGTPPDFEIPIQLAADRSITCERTGLGFRFDGDGIETTVYWADGWWQTTIPYWVDLCGAVSNPRVEDLVEQGAALPMEG